MASVVRLYLRPSARTPVREVTSAKAIAGKGLEGDHAGGGGRQVTLMEKEAWEAACQELGGPLDPGGRRANVVVEGFSLAPTIGRRIRVGKCIIEVVGENPPCRLMDDVAQGLMRALQSSCRGGVYGRIVTGGQIAVGVPIALLTQ